MVTLASAVKVKQVVLSSAGKLSTGTITPAADPYIPNSVQAADVISAASWTFTDQASGVGFPIAANEVKHFPGSFVKDLIFSAGTYTVCFYQHGV